MNLAVIYVFPQVDLKRYLPLARRFADTYRQFRPGLPHALHVVCNASSPGDSGLAALSGIECSLHVRENNGWDIGAFQWAAENIPADLMVCLGAPVHFHQPLWLELMVEAYIQNGLNLYGCWAYLSPNWHVRTTMFACPPELIRSYPLVVASSRASRYEFEHGNHSFTRHVLGMGADCIMVTRKGCFPFSQWEGHAPGPQDSLAWDQHVHG